VTQGANSVARRVLSLLPRRAMDFFIHNPETPQHTNTPEVLFILELRLDGGAAIRIPGDVILDEVLRNEMLAYTRALSIHPPIPGCARPASVFVGSVWLRDGAIVLAPIATGSAPESALPSGRPLTRSGTCSEVPAPPRIAVIWHD
jgi:hypothetical protein